MAIYGNMVVPSKAAGGALPTDNSDRNVYVPGTEVSARYSDAGGVLAAQGQQKAAEGLGNLGKGLGALGGMGLAFYTRQRRIEHAEAMEAVARLQTEYIEKQREWSQIKGANAINMEELKSRWWDEAIPRYTEGLSDYGKRYFNLNADRVGAMADTFIQHHQEQQINQYESTQLKVAMDSESNMINLDPYNQQQTSASIGRIQALIHQDCMRKGLPPEVEQQMVRQAVGTAFGNAIAIQIQQGRLDGAQQLFAQYQGYIPADQQSKLLDSYDSSVRQRGASLAQLGDTRGLESLLHGAAGGGVAGSFDQAIAARAAQYNGRKYGGVGGFDCSAYIRTIGKDQVAPQYRSIFDGSSEHMLDTAGRLSGHLYRGSEVNAGTITSGGWLIGIAEPNAKHVRATKSERPNDIGHVAMTFMQNGVVMVTENASGAGVRSMPLAQYLDTYKGRKLFAANLNALQQAGAQRGSGGTVNVLPQYKPMLEQAAQQAGVDPVLLQAIAMQESDGGRDLRTSRAGAVGLMQIMPSVAKEIGGNRDNMQDNIRMGAQYFAKMLKMSGGDVREALLRYNWGPGNVDAWKKTGKGVNGQEMPQEAQEYADKVLGHIKGGTAGAQAQPAQAMPAVKMSKEAKETYDAWKGMHLNPAQLMEMAQGMASSSDKAKSQRGREILAALQSEQQGQASAPAQAAMPQGGVQPALPGVGGGAGVSGLGVKPDTQLHFQSVLAPQAMANSMWKELEAVPADRLDYEYDKRMQAMQKENPALYSKVDSLVRPMVKHQKDIYKAESEQRVYDWAAKIASLDPIAQNNTIGQAVAAGTISQEEGARALLRVTGKKEDNINTRASVLEIKMKIDRGEITSRQQIEAAAVNSKLTNAQINDCLEYQSKGGQKGIVQMTQINNAWKQWKRKQGDTVKDGDMIPADLANYVYADMTPGKIPSEQELEKSIAEGMVKGKGWFGKEAYKAWADNDSDWEIGDIPEGLKLEGVTSREQMWSRVDEWIYTQRPDLKRGQITDAMRRAALRELIGMPRWGLTEENARRAR